MGRIINRWKEKRRQNERLAKLRKKLQKAGKLDKMGEALQLTTWNKRQGYATKQIGTRK